MIPVPAGVGRSTKSVVVRDSLGAAVIPERCLLDANLASLL